MDDGVSVLERASGILRTFAHDLRDQQEIAKDARRAGREAEGRANAAVKSLQTAVADGAAATGAADTAATEAATARGTADAAGALDADRRESTARAAAGRAKATESKARGALTDANDDIVRAIKKAEKANRLADAAAQRTRTALMDATAAAKTALINLGPIPVPVTPTPTNSSPFNSTGPFDLPFHGLTPGDVRRQDIEAAAAAAREAAENKPLNGLQKFGRALFSTGFAPIDALTFGQAGKLVSGMPNGRVWDPDAGAAKVTKWFGPGVVAKKGLAKGADKIVGNAKKKGPLPRIFPAHPRDKLPPMAPTNVPRKVKITRGPDGRPRVEGVREPGGRGGAESRKGYDGRNNGPKQTSGDRREALSNTARIGINTNKAIDDMMQTIAKLLG